MHKKINIFILMVFLAQSLLSKEPTMAILQDIESNDIQHFKFGNYQFTCLAYGVLSIDELYRESALDSKCQESINGFYNKRADLKYYTNSKLKVMQLYNVEFKDSRCIIYTSGGKSLSEFLLEEGLAVIKPLFKDEEFQYYFLKAQKKAKMSRNGIWAKNITRECISNIYNK